MKNLKLIFSLLLAISFTTIYAQDDAEKKCVDYPSISHLNYFEIYNCSKIYNEVDIPVGKGKNKKVEGNVFDYQYMLAEDANPDYRISWLQLHRNFENAIKKVGGKILFSNDAVDEDHVESFLLTKENKEIYILIQPDGGSETNGYTGYLLKVVEKEAMKQEVDANVIFDALNTDGHIALHINFETGKSIIKAESQKIVTDIFDMLQNNPNIKISIEGHTDNVGNAGSNKTLSENRAKAVLDALVSKGISKTRLSSKGWGSSKPVADNSTEDGKAANRRVEIVKM